MVCSQVAKALFKNYSTRSEFKKAIEMADKLKSELTSSFTIDASLKITELEEMVQW